MRFRFLWGFFVFPCFLVFGQGLKSERDSIRYFFQGSHYEQVIHHSSLWSAKVKRAKRNTTEYASILRLWGESLRKTGRIEEARPVLIQAYTLNSNANTDSVELANTCFHLAHLYRQREQFDSARFFYFKCLDIRQMKLGKTHHDVASVLYSLGSFCAQLGQPKEAETFYFRSIQVSKQLNHLTHSLADAYNGLSVLYNAAADYQKAEEFGLKSLEEGERFYGANHLKTALSLNSLGTLYEQIGNYEKAEYYFLRCLNIWTSAHGEMDLDVADACNNLGALYIEWGKPAMAEPYLLKNLKIRTSLLGPHHIQTGVGYLNLGNFYYVKHQYERAGLLLSLALEIYSEKLGPAHPELIDPYNNLAAVYRETGKPEKADSLYRLVLSLIKSHWGSNHPLSTVTNSRLGALALERKMLPEAEPYFHQYLEEETNQVKRYFRFLSESEKEKLLGRMKGYLEVFKWFCVENYTRNPQSAAALFDQQLTFKSLLLNNSSKWRQAIRTCPDLHTKALFRTWEANQNQLVQLHQSVDVQDRASLNDLQNETERIEKELSIISDAFVRLKDTLTPTWLDVQKALKPGEGAVEIIRIRRYGSRSDAIDSSGLSPVHYVVKGITDSVVYVALIVKPGDSYPEMVVLSNGNDLETRAIRDYRKCIQREMDDKQSYTRFWAKIALKIRDLKRVYLSPDGVYHLLNLSTLKNPTTGIYVLDEQDIRVVSSTKDLVNASPSTLTRNAVLIGFPQYKSSSDSSTNRWKSIKELPGAQLEVHQIEDLFLKAGWQVNKFSGLEASEKKLKNLRSPKALHLATHGFFQKDTVNTAYPLLHSGLLLAGAASGGMEGEDGILYSHEAMNLPLDSTDLVVLSACETGLGTLKDGEGVYGLQRAFKVAGARSVVMSLWKVSDKATQALMVRFYKRWLSLKHEGQKNQKDERPLYPERESDAKRFAFREAQKELKAMFPSPYYWGAFVLVGD